MRCRLLVLFLFMLFPLPIAAQNPQLGIAGRPAPSWDLEWLNLPAESSPLALEDFRGKVLYVFCFQSWCPGCHSHGFPTLKQVEQHYQGNDDVHFVAIQTVFEGLSTNTRNRAVDDIENYGLEIPLAHDQGEHGISPFMRAYRTGGTPWTILIDPDGNVAWNGFQLEPEQAIAVIDRLVPKHDVDETETSETMSGR